MFSVDEIMIALLDSDKKDIVYIACGVLVNLMGDEENRSALKTHHGIQK